MDRSAHHRHIPCRYREEGQLDAGSLWLRERNIHSHYLVPWSRDGEKLEAVGFGARIPHAFGPEDLRFLEQVAEPVR
jgi:hypothetical protein